MKSEIAGFVLRSKDPEATAQFYQQLGIEIGEPHSHGNGPMHQATGKLSADGVTEIYQRSDLFPNDAIMVQTDDFYELCERLEKHRIHLQGNIKCDSVRGNKRYAYVQDPDGRSVLLLEK